MIGLNLMQEKPNHSQLSLVLERPVLRSLSLSLSPVEAYRQLGLEKASCFLFERGADGGANETDETFVMFSPMVTFRILPEGLWIEGIRAGGLKFNATIPGNPVKELQKLLESGRVEGGDDLPSFSCGVVGYLGYDCVRYLENIPLPETISGEDEACFVLFRHILVADRRKGETLLVSHVLPGESRAAIAVEQDQIAEKLTRTGTKPSISSYEKGSGGLTLKSPVATNDFEAAVGKIRRHILEGDIFQCVISKRFSGKFSQKAQAGELAVYETLRDVNPSPYHFHFASSGQTLVGASPEMLVKVKGTKISTCPIAGTRARGGDPAEDKRRERQLLDSPKETSEHVMLVDLSRNDIGKVSAPGTVRVPEFMKVHRFSHVMHLVSLVEGELSPKYSPWDALLSCFPAGTLTGAPKIRAMQIISALETQRRGAYGGAIVLFDFRGELDSCINIRSMVTQGDQCYVQAGAGVVFDSRAAREEEEIENKSLVTRQAVEGIL